MYYVAVDIGCIECGVETNVLGIFTDRIKAQEVLDKHAKRRGNGIYQAHSFELFEIEELNKEHRVEHSPGSFFKK